MPQSPPFTPIKFVLCVRKTKTAPKDMADRPNGFMPVLGDHPTVNAEATRLNNVQKGLAEPFYFFYPEATPADYNRLHCDMCKRVAAREAAADD